MSHPNVEPPPIDREPIRSTTHNEQEWTSDDLGTPLRAADVDGDPYDRPQPVDVPADVRQTVTLTQHMLGLDPYTLITAVKTEPDDEDDDGFRLKVEHGGGSSGAELATLFVLNLPAAQNPLTAAIKAVIDANPDEHVVPEVLAMFAEFCDIPMPESGK